MKNKEIKKLKFEKDYCLLISSKTNEGKIKLMRELFENNTLGFKVIALSKDVDTKEEKRVILPVEEDEEILRKIRDSITKNIINKKNINASINLMKKM